MVARERVPVEREGVHVRGEGGAPRDADVARGERVPDADGRGRAGGEGGRVVVGRASVV